MHLLDPLDNHEFSLLEATCHDNIFALLDTGRYASQLDLLCRVNQEDIVAGLIKLDGGLRNHQNRPRLTAIHRNADNSTGDKKTLRVRHLRPYRHGVRAGIGLDVKEVTEAGMRIDATVGQPDVNGHVRVLVGQFGDSMPVLENITLARLKGDVDRVSADDCCKFPGRWVDQISNGEFGNSDLPIDG